MVFSCLSCFCCNRNNSGSPQMIRTGSSVAGSCANTEAVVQDVYNSSQARSPSGNRASLPSPVSARIISPLPSMEMSQIPPAPPYLADSREDSNSLFDPASKHSLFDSASKHGSGEESVESNHKEWSFSHSRRSQEDPPQLREQQVSWELEGGQVSWIPLSSSMRVAPLIPAAEPAIKGEDQDSDSEKEDSLYNPKASFEHREESLEDSQYSTPFVSRTSTPVNSGRNLDLENNQEDSDLLFAPKDEVEENSSPDLTPPELTLPKPKELTLPEPEELTLPEPEELTLPESESNNLEHDQSPKVALIYLRNQKTKPLYYSSLFQKHFRE